MASTQDWFEKATAFEKEDRLIEAADWAYFYASQATAVARISPYLLSETNFDIIP